MNEYTDHLLIGTYTGNGSEGIYVCEFDAVKGTIRSKYTIPGVANPSYLILSPDKRLVFAVNESGERPSDHVSSFRYDQASGMLQFIGAIPSGGIHPCHLSTDVAGKRLFISNYTSGTLTIADISDSGQLKILQTIQHHGHSLHIQRQESAHVHSSLLSPDQSLLFAADLGTDTLQAYKHDAADASEPLSYAYTVASAPGSGPRHFIFSAGGQYLYVLQELDATVAVYDYTDNQPNHIQTIAATATGFAGENCAAEILLSPDGKFLYTSNRGTANELSVFAVNADNGKLSLVEIVSSQGKAPRNFILSQNGRWLLAAHQDSNDIQVFQRDTASGKLTHTGNSFPIPSPVCLKLVARN